MKVVFANPPHIKNLHSSADNSFAITRGWLDKIRQPHHWPKIKGIMRIYNFLNKFLPLYDGTRYGVRAGSRWPWSSDRPLNSPHFPFFMAYAASYLQSKWGGGIEVKLLDAIVSEQYDYQEFLNEIQQENADLVFIECSTPTIAIDTWFASQIANFTLVALCGPHLNDKTIEEIRQQYPKINFFLKGEYIISSLECAIQAKEGSKEGIYESQVVKDLDDIPFPFRDYKNSSKYYDPSMPTPKPQLQIYASKGCPFKCTFCSWPQNMYFGNVAQRSPEKIRDEINEAIKKHNYKSIFFDDDTFNIGEERISKLCDYLKEIGLPWTMMGRLDCSPIWLYDKMVESGCVGMRFGIETFNQEVLKKVRKGIERKDFRYTLEHICTKYPNLMIHLTMMKDMPGQTEEMHQLDLQILKNLGFSTDYRHPRNFQLSRCVPFPGTQMYEEIKQKKNNIDQYDKYDGSQHTIMKEIQE